MLGWSGLGLAAMAWAGLAWTSMACASTGLGVGLGGWLEVGLWVAWELGRGLCWGIG